MTPCAELALAILRMQG